MKEELKPCPFCGGEARETTDSDPFTWCTDTSCQYYDIEIHLDFWQLCARHEESVCSACGGKGYIEEDQCGASIHKIHWGNPDHDSHGKCSFCHGNYIPSCPTCHGTGRVKSRLEEIEEEEK